MRFVLGITTRPNVFIPYQTHSRNYFLLFHYQVPAKSHLSVVEDTTVTVPSFFDIGLLSTNGKVCGNIFYTAAATQGYGSSIAAYSKKWAKQINSGSMVDPSGVSLLIKSPHFYMYHKKNEVTLIVSPCISTHIRENLEI